MNKAPAFQFYPADYLADMRVRMLSWASRGLYMDLLCYCWREGWIPSDESAIAQLCNCHDLAIIEPCLSLFDSHPEDEKKLIHKRLDSERKKQLVHSNERSTTGKKGAEARWGKGKRAHGSAIKQPLAKNGSSSSSSPSTSVVTILKNSKGKCTMDEAESFAVEIGLPKSDGEATFHKWEGSGWVNGKNPVRDWKATMRSWKTAGYMPSQKQSKAKQPGGNHAGIFESEMEGF